MQAINNIIYRIKTTINPSGTVLNNTGKFARRIQQRHQAFWRSDDVEDIRKAILFAGESIEKWKAGVNWQRKLSNKFNSKEFAKMHGCEVAKLYWKGRNVNTIDFTSLPANYVIRPSAGDSCNLVFLMSDSMNLMDKTTYSHESIKSIITDALNADPDLEFLIEEFVKKEDGNYAIPVDYKFYAFNGEIALIEVIDRLSRKKGFVTYYDTSWNMIEKIIMGKYPEGTYQPPPKCLNTMMEQVKTLSRAYEIFVRIDFYATDRGPVFGEFTPTPGASNYLKIKFDNMLTRYWDSYCRGRI